MSPDDILAANLWPWPDPLLKRNPSGGVIFVNAAFLQLYGGRVEDWSGQNIPGWPAPNLQGAQRFETRSGEATSPAVYDWVETIMADGNTMAIARNVTIFMTPPTSQPAPEIHEVAPQTQTPPAPVAAAPTSVTVAESIIKDTPAPAPQTTSTLAETLNNDADDYRYDDTPPPTPNTPSAPDAVAKPAQEDRRMIERRALPIEDTATVLGNNWRDEVIAKALGTNAPSTDAASEDNTAKTATHETPTNTGIAQTSKGLNILLAEDNAINALLTRTLLEAEGANVTTVEDGALAVEAAHANDYDLIFMDMRMPNMDGLEATRKIRAIGKTMPIVALTANAFDDDRNACFDSGMNDFMTKPVSAEELSEMVITWVNNTKEKIKLAS